jgi:alkylated DNA nucleotide flippase Atl1
MARKRKSWREKLADDKDFPRIVPIEGKLRERWGEGTCLIPRPRDVAEVMRRVPPGKVITVDRIRAHLARTHGATISCPLTTGIFARIAAEAAAEDEAEGKAPSTPYWRTLKTGGEINPKYPGGAEGQARRLESEGLRIVHRGKRLLVADHEQHLHTL